MKTPNCHDYMCEKILFIAFFFEFLWPMKVSNLHGSLVHHLTRRRMVLSFTVTSLMTWWHHSKTKPHSLFCATLNQRTAKMWNFHTGHKNSKKNAANKFFSHKLSGQLVFIQWKKTIGASCTLTVMDAFTMYLY